MMPRLLLITTLFVVGVATVSCSGDKPKAQAELEVVRDVALLPAAKATVPDSVEAVGTVRAAQSAQLASQLMGTVVAVTVREGDTVKRGQVLAVVDDQQPRAGMERAEAAVNAANHDAAAAESDYALAASTLKRYESLFAKKSVSPQEFDEVKARHAAASARRELAKSGQAQSRAALAQARTQLEYTRIRAPFDGVVTGRHVDPGAMAAPGMPLITVEGTGRLRLEASVDERSVAAVTLGKAVPVIVEALSGAPVQGRVAQIVPAADPSTRSFTVKIELPANPALRSGLFGRAHFAVGERESLVVPKSALVQRGQMQGLYVVGENNVAGLRYVTVGTAVGEGVEVLSGLTAGERIVASPGMRELGGKKVEVQ